MWKDVIMHLTFTQTFDFANYIATPIGVASWTVAIEMQAYLLFPLLAKWARKNPLGTLSTMAAIALLFRSLIVFGMKDYNMVVNQLINFLDVYAMGMGAAILYVKLTTLYPAEDKRRFIWQAVATAAIVLAFCGLKELLQDQAGSNGQTEIQAGQMIRRPLFAALLGMLTLALPFAVLPLRFLFGNKLMGFLAMISMNYYLMHQNIAVHLKRIQFPPAEHYPNPNMLAGGPEEPWKYQYTALCFGLSILTAIAITFLIEKPGAWTLKKGFRWVEERLSQKRTEQPSK
jgi:peptidoglycan/LPS O-acetylase OafA/YrhL